MLQNSELIRKKFREADDIRDAGLTTPEDVVRFDGLRYGPDPVWQTLDVYRPRAMEGQTLPVIVSVHGGGWVYGDRQRYQYYCMDLCRRGFAVVNFSYRLAPENKFPASMEDINTVFHWVPAHAAEYGLDAGRVCAVGDSAGAHQLALYCCICASPDYAARYAFRPPEGFVPAAVALNCGVYAITGPQAGEPSPLLREVLPGGGTPDELEQIDVLRHLNRRFPAAFIMTATGDFLKSQAPVLAAALTELDVPYECRFYSGGEKPLGHVFHCNIRTKDAQRCNDDTCDFFRRALRL